MGYWGADLRGRSSRENHLPQPSSKSSDNSRLEKCNCESQVNCRSLTGPKPWLCTLCEGRWYFNANSNLVNYPIRTISHQSEDAAWLSWRTSQGPRHVRGALSYAAGRQCYRHISRYQLWYERSREICSQAAAGCLVRWSLWLGWRNKRWRRSTEERIHLPHRQEWFYVPDNQASASCSDSFYPESASWKQV